MTRALALLVGFLGTGCLVVPAKHVTKKPAPNETGHPTFATQKSIELTARADGNHIYVHAIRHGECSRPVYAVTEVTTERKAKLGGADDPRAAALGFVLAPVLIPLSALYTGFVLAADDPETDHERRLLGTEHFACSQEAERYILSLTMPSGEKLAETTDEHGEVTFELPPSDTYTGVATLVGDGAEAKQVPYSLPRPAITVAKEAALECGAKYQITGPVELKISVNESGHPTRLWVSAGGDDYNRCVGMRLSGQRFPERMRDATVKLPITIQAPAAASL